MVVLLIGFLKERDPKRKATRNKSLKHRTMEGRKQKADQRHIRYSFQFNICAIIHTVDYITALKVNVKRTCKQIKVSRANIVVRIQSMVRLI